MSISSAELASEPVETASSATPHPEEMRATVNIAIGRSVMITATARTTPAGLVTAALLVVAILVPMIWLAGPRRHRRARIC